MYLICILQKFKTSLANYQPKILCKDRKGKCVCRNFYIGYLCWVINMYSRYVIYCIYAEYVLKLIYKQNFLLFKKLKSLEILRVTESPWQTVLRRKYLLDTRRTNTSTKYKYVLGVKTKCSSMPFQHSIWLEYTAFLYQVSITQLFHASLTASGQGGYVSISIFA